MTAAPRALALLCACAASSGAGAAELARSDDGSRLVEASGFVKPYAGWLLLPPELVAATAELERALDEARALVPPEYRAELPDGVTLPEHVGISTWTGRVQGKATLLGSLELEAAWQAALVLSTSSSVGAGAPQMGVLGGSSAEPARRLIDFDAAIVDEGGLRVLHNLDRLLLRWQTPDFALTVGRQALSWGAGRLWNPTDLVSPFSPTDVDREVRRGADAVRLSLPLGALSQMELLWLPRQELDEQGVVVRAQTNLWQTDLSGSAAKYVDDLVLGADLAGDLGPLGVHGEVAWTIPARHPQRDHFARAVAGLDWRPFDELVLGAEYYWNGFGSDDKDEIVARLTDVRAQRGEVFGAGRHYVGLVASWLPGELLTVNATAIVNASDTSVLLVPALEYWLEQSVLLRAGAFVPYGLGVDVARFEALGGDDVLGRSAAFDHALRTLEAQSEHGLTPAGVFVQVGAYVP
ncbi:MAG: hypothetical protein IT383_27040 [Deltaproteobacteria bacterium]|nr:hypothetical protein [Deltaproteobacteria bacterium]